MPTNSKNKQRNEDKTGQVAVFAAIALVVIATLLYLNFSSVKVAKTPDKITNTPTQLPPQVSSAPTVGGHSFSIGSGSTDSSSTSHTENGDGS